MSMWHQLLLHKKQLHPLKIIQRLSCLHTKLVESDIEVMLHHPHWRRVWKFSSITAGCVWMVSQLHSQHLTAIWDMYACLLFFKNNGWILFFTITMDENQANYLNKMLTQCCINMKYCCFEFERVAIWYLI